MVWRRQCSRTQMVWICLVGGLVADRFDVEVASGFGTVSPGRYRLYAGWFKGGRRAKLDPKKPTRLVIFATPVYFGDLSESMKALTDRMRRTLFFRQVADRSGIEGKWAIGVCVAGGTGFTGGTPCTGGGGGT